MPTSTDNAGFRFPLYQVSGSPQEMGRQHGEQARLKIVGYLGYLCETLGFDDRQLASRAARFRDEFTRHCPQLLDEVDGLAEGAGISRDLALASQLRGELGGLSDGGCTTFAIGPRGTANGEVLIGQTSDMPAEIRGFGYVLQVCPDDRPRAIMWSFGGMIGYHGVNEHGVAHFANALGGGPAWKFALSHYPLKRLILEQSSMDEVLKKMREFAVCSNGNYMLCDGDKNILDVELTSDGPFPIDDSGEGFLVHSNHYLCAEHSCQANFDQSLPDSFPRLERMRSLIHEKFGSITVEDVKQFLSDHDGHPVGICRHPHEGYGDAILPASGHTAAAMIAEPASGKFHVVCGNPCENAFLPFEL